MNRHTRLLRRPPTEDPHRSSAPPLYLSATYQLSDAEGATGSFDYARSGNPTRQELEARLADLEGADRSFAFASGLAALRALIASLPPCPHIVVSADLYGGSLRLLGEGQRRGELRLTPGRDETEIEAALAEGADLLLVESPGNPGLGVLDLPRLLTAARRAKVASCVDASLLSPWLCQPLALGADVVLHSGTKFLGGHADLTAGVLSTNDADFAERFAFIQNAEGNALAPFDGWLLMRGLDTLGLRVERQQETAVQVAARLAAWNSDRKDGVRILHPSLPDHPGATVHARQARGPGSLISLDLSTRERARRFLSALEGFRLTVSFGSVRSTVCLPASMSHASVPDGLREGSRAHAGLVRLSVGLEDPEDLAGHLVAALDALNTNSAGLSSGRRAAGSRS